MINKARILIVAILLFLVVAIDFTGKMMSILADGVLVLGVVASLWPLIKNQK
ncbi:hypothetical protein M977_04523 [Buttiauxella gaviniae ATCC 51604]|uniref:DUF3927 domain-containing protein n=1 Tax=Buttiauxella gaviniae ATCC 51604 TaxID=1354253 RepID=A0A1B7HMA1_9ENTR|nr:DUF3927 family protein [Buttiauxella gaviniae]OAT16773.1 hypothetical protein M977_04523 [Buttiauxella gaviniae ATCC 51604]